MRVFKLKAPSVIFLSVVLSCRLTDRPVKRKRGRPKGSKKKSRTDLTESKADSTQSDVQRDEEKEKGDEQSSSATGNFAICMFPTFPFFRCTLSTREAACLVPILELGYSSG